MAAIAKPALRRQRHDVVEGGGNARGGIVELQLAQPRGIGEPAATGQRQKGPRSTVVWRPFESLSRIDPVRWSPDPRKVFASVDLPTPDDPNNAIV